MRIIIDFDTLRGIFKVKGLGEDAMRAAFAITDKQERTAAVSAARETIKEGLDEEEAEWRERAESAAQFYNTSVSKYDNREEDGVVVSDANEALNDG